MEFLLFRWYVLFIKSIYIWACVICQPIWNMSFLHDTRLNFSQNRSKWVLTFKNLTFVFKTERIQHYPLITVFLTFWKNFQCFFIVSRWNYFGKGLYYVETYLGSDQTSVKKHFAKRICFCKMFYRRRLTRFSVAFDVWLWLLFKTCKYFQCMFS